MNNNILNFINKKKYFFNKYTKYALFILIITLLSFLIKFTLIKFSDIELIDENGIIQNIKLPYNNRSDENKKYIYKGKIKKSLISRRLVKIIPDDCVEYIKINNIYVDLSNISPNKLRDWQHGFDISLDLKTGYNDFEISIHDNGGLYGLNLKNSLNDPLLLTLIILLLIVISALLYFCLIEFLRLTKLSAFIILIAISLRIILALVNREANDNHLEVMQLLLRGFRSLSMKDCHECFQPKLYYYVCALIFKIFSIDSRVIQIITAQMINVTAGVITIFIIYYFLQDIGSKNKIKLFVFSLIALNPRLIGINACASNDSFVILFSTLTIYFFYKFLTEKKFQTLFVMVVFMILAIMSKGTSFVICVGILLVFLLKIIFDFKNKILRNKYILSFIITIIMIPASIFLADYDFANYDNYGHQGKNAPLYLFKKHIVVRPGVVSIVDSYLTFRMIDLIKHPTITNGKALIPIHRSSLWTQLYGRTHFVHFDSWPPSWQTKNAFILNLGRAILILALVPLIIFLFGIFINLKKMLNLIRIIFILVLIPMMMILFGISFKFKKTLFNFIIRKYKLFIKKCDWIFIMFTIGYFLFIIKFTYDYRGFDSMKIIYLLPGILAFSKVLYDGMEKFYKLKFMNKVMSIVLNTTIIIILALYSLNIVSLFTQLAVK